MSTGVVLLGILASIVTGIGLMFTISHEMESRDSKRNCRKQSVSLKKYHDATLITIIIIFLLGIILVGTASFYLIYSNDNSAIRYFDAIFYGIVLTSSIYYISEVVLMFLRSLFKTIKSKILNNK